MNVGRMMTSCIWFNHVCFSKYRFLKSSNYWDLIFLISLGENFIFFEIFIFWNLSGTLKINLSQECCSNSHNCLMYISREIVSTKIFLHKEYLEKLWIFDIYIWCHSVDIATTRTVVSCKWWDHSWFSRIFLLQILSFPLPVSK